MRRGAGKARIVTPPHTASALTLIDDACLVTRTTTTTTTTQ